MTAETLAVDGRADLTVDVAVVGGGVVGAAVARLLSHHRIDVALVERRADVGAETSKANTAILHTGFDATPGSVESRLVARGYRLIHDYAPAAGISIERTGAVLVAWTDDQAEALAGLRVKAAANGYHGTELVDPATVYEREPHLGPGARGGLVVADEHIIDPWTPVIAFAGEAVANGATLWCGFDVAAIEPHQDSTVLVGRDGRRLRTRFVVNAAGLGGDHLQRLFGVDGFRITPRRGQLVVYDKLARSLLQHIVLPVPTAVTKGVLVSPTVFGNVMVGPTAEDLDDRADTATTRAGLDGLVAAAQRLVPALAEVEVTATYAGLRAATEHSDYRLSADADRRLVCLGGIRSTGLTASMAVAEEALRLLAGIGLEATPKDDIVAVHRTPLGERDERPYRSGGVIVCHCERVTAAEIAGAVSGPVAAADLDGIRRRTRASAGRCQGFACLAEVCATAARATSGGLQRWSGLP